MRRRRGLLLLVLVPDDASSPSTSMSRAGRKVDLPGHDTCHAADSGPEMAAPASWALAPAVDVESNVAVLVVVATGVAAAAGVAVSTPSPSATAGRPPLGCVPACDCSVVRASFASAAASASAPASASAVIVVVVVVVVAVIAAVSPVPASLASGIHSTMRILVPASLNSKRAR